MTKITFEDLPSTNTPLNASNLNTMQDNVEDAINSVDTELNSKQDTLVSGTNIKTINNNSILGSGNITIGSSTIVGGVLLYSGSTAPDGYLLCDGTAVSRTTYSELYSVIGTTYGSGDGSTTFNLPNLKGKVPVGLDSNDSDFDTLGETGGEKTHTLTVNEMPSHTHSLKTSYTSGSNTDNDKVMSASSSSGWNNNAHNEYSIQETGGGQAHNILQPYIVMNYIIKY